MSRQITRFLTLCCAPGVILCMLPQSLLSSTFDQTNLVSDVSGLAISTDPNLKNPWGVSFSATSPFWVSDQVTNVATLYTGNGSTIVGGVVAGTPGGPTGQVFNSTTDFVEPDKSPASFIFATLGGKIYAWNGGNGVGPSPPAPASLEATTSGGFHRIGASQ